MDHLSGVRKQMKSSLNKPEGSVLQATALKEDFNLPEICWKSRIAEHEQSRLLEGVRNNLVVALHGPPRGDAQLNVQYQRHNGNAETLTGTCRDCVRKAKAHLKFRLRRDIKDNN